MYDGWAADAGIEVSASIPFDLQQVSNAPQTLLPRQHEALARLEYVATRQRGFALLTGPAGSGKTLVLREFADELRRNAVATVCVDASGCGGIELLRECCDELGLGCSRDAAAESLSAVLLDAVRGRCEVGTPLVLIIDHAGRGDDGAARLLERLLHATNDVAGPTLVAACREPAPSELAAMARGHADVRIQLPPLTADDTGSVMDALSRADSRCAEFTPRAVQDMHALAGGDLHRVNRLWRLAQNAAKVEEVDSIDAQMIEWVSSELPA